MSKLIVVSNRLPLRIDDDGKLARSDGGLASAMRGVSDDGGDTIRWVGWPGQLPLKDVKGAVYWSQRLREEGYEPVFFDGDRLYERYYEGYANATLWPILHYMVVRARFFPDWFEAYEEVNRRFCDAVLRIAEPGDRVWVHDYQLMLLPGMLRERCPSLKIGFFLHVPFPSQEVFRVLPEREHLLRGVLGADLIGFHTFGYLRHFRSALLRGIDQESLPDRALVEGRGVRFGVYPIGHNRAGFDQVTKETEYREQLAELEREFEGRRLVLSVERLDYTKGIPQKLTAIERFLSEHPERARDTVFLIVAVPSRGQVDAYRELAETVQLAVSDINGRFSTFSRQPVHLYQRGVSHARLAALYAFADVALVTPLIDGMNLVAKEFVDCKGSEGARPGVLILSEMAGAAQELAGAVLVNPYDASGVASAIASALSRSTEDRQAAMQRMRARVRRRDAAAWAKAFVTDLAREPERPRDPTAELPGSVVERLAKAENLLVILDYDGTLRRFENRPEDATPDASLRALLLRLCELPHTRVAIVSGRPEDFLMAHFGELPLVLVAEHGFRMRLPGEEFVDANPRADLSWVPIVKPILEQAADLTPGSELEAKRSALVWHYRRAEPEYGSWRASELAAALTDTAANMPVEVHRGHKIVEVASQQVSKGAALDHLMKTTKPSAAVAIGDDRTDESMFRRRDAFPMLDTIKVGSGETVAAWRLPSVDAVMGFLGSLADAREKPADGADDIGVMREEEA